jgi:hypothetical protein
MVIVTGTAKKRDVNKKKGELIEQNQDGLEVVFLLFCTKKFI